MTTLKIAGRSIFILEKSMVAELAILLIYLSTWHLSRWFALFSSIRAIVGFVILTYVLGDVTRAFLKNVVKLSRLPSTFSLTGIICDILLSLVLGLTMDIILVRAFIFHEQILIGSVLGTIVILSLAALHAMRRRTKLEGLEIQTLRRPAMSSVATLAVLIITSTVFASDFRGITPLPLITGWDIWPSLTCTKWLISNHGYPYLFVPSFPKPTLTPYPALFFYLIASYSLFLGVDPLLVYWYSVYVLIFGYMSLVYLIAKKLSGNHWLSLTSAIAAFFIGAPSANVVRTPLYLTLDMAGLTLFLIIVVLQMHCNVPSIEKRIITLISIIYLAVLNYPTIIWTFPFILYFLVGNNAVCPSIDGRRVFRYSAVMTVTGLFILIILVGHYDPGLASYFSVGPFPYSSKAETIQAMYPTYFWILFFASVFSIFVRKSLDHVDRSRYLDLLLYVLCGFAIYFAPAWITYRIEFYLRVFIAVLVTGFLPIYKDDSKLLILKISSSRFSIKPRNVEVAASACIFLLTFVQMYPLFANYTSQVDSYISKDEYEAAQWISANTSPESYILTDAGSGYVIRGLALRNASTFFILPDGRAPSDLGNQYPNLRFTLHSFFSSQSSAETLRYLKKMPFNDIYIVVTSRTVVWAFSPAYAFFAHPFDGVNYTLVTWKFEPPCFVEVYSSNTVKIYKPNLSPRSGVETSILISHLGSGDLIHLSMLAHAKPTWCLNRNTKMGGGGSLKCPPEALRGSYQSDR